MRDDVLIEKIKAASYETDNDGRDFPWQIVDLKDVEAIISQHTPIVPEAGDVERMAHFAALKAFWEERNIRKVSHEEESTEACLTKALQAYNVIIASPGKTGGAGDCSVMGEPDKTGIGCVAAPTIAVADEIQKKAAFPTNLPAHQNQARRSVMKAYEFAWPPAGINSDGAQHYTKEELVASKSRFRIASQHVWMKNENGKIFYMECLVCIDKIYTSNGCLEINPTKAFIRRAGKIAKALKDDTWHCYAEATGKRRKLLISLDGNEVNP